MSQDPPTPHSSQTKKTSSSPTLSATMPATMPSPGTPLFTLPIPPLPPQYPEGGTITCTEPQPQVYLLTFVSPPDNRLTTPFCNAMLLALEIIEFSYPIGVVVTTSGIPKFYSNGLDLGHAVATEGYWSEKLYTLWKRFLTWVFFLLASVSFSPCLAIQLCLSLYPSPLHILYVFLFFLLFLVVFEKCLQCLTLD